MSASVGRDQQWCSGSHFRELMSRNTSVRRIRTTADRYHGGHLPCGVHDSIADRRSASHDASRRWPVRCIAGSRTAPSIVAPVRSQGPPRDRRPVPIVVRYRRDQRTAAVCDPRRGSTAVQGWPVAPIGRSAPQRIACGIEVSPRLLVGSVSCRFTVVSQWGCQWLPPEDIVDREATVSG